MYGKGKNSAYSLIAAYVSSSLILCDFIDMYDRIPITSFWLHYKNGHVAALNNVLTNVFDGFNASSLAASRSANSSARLCLI